ncbi:MAG: tetratricopeptide repeat protein [Azospirillum sp.]|nr:tetratricopeptide repeat protein [Azospirillum sp.]
MLRVMRRWNRRAILGMAAGGLLAARGAVAQTDPRPADPRLDRLFERLKAASDPREAQTIEAAIWQAWLDPQDGGANSLMRLGVDAQQRGDLYGAFALFDAIVNLKPGYAEGWNRRATILFQLGRLEDSRKDAEKTLELEPRHFGALSGLGMIALRLDQPDKALEAFEKALAVHPHLPAAKAHAEALRSQRRPRERAI